jgi:hypothetical protein
MNASITAACQKQCPKTGNPMEDGCCMSKCIFAQIGLSNSDGSFNSEVAESILKKATSNPDAWTSTMQSVLGECVADGKFL